MISSAAQRAREIMPTRNGTTRRDVLKGIGLAGASLPIGCDANAPGGGLDGDPDGGTAAPPDLTVENPPEPPEKVPASTQFPLGVAAGDPTATGAVFWARYAGAQRLELVVYEMRGDSYAREVATVDATPSMGDGGFVLRDVAGLAPGAPHRYAFFELDADGKRLARSPIGRLRAPARDDALVEVTLGAVACTAYGRSFAPLARAAARPALDGFLFLGDTVYCDGAKSRDDYRKKWARTLGTDEYCALRSAHVSIATWDDHEVDNDWNPETLDGAQLAAATGAFFEHQPVRRDPSAPSRIWRRVRFGRTVEIFVLDCRSERKPSTRTGASAQYISQAQLDWLKAGLASSDAVFKVIMNSVPVSSFPGAFQAAPGDRWEGYAAQRRALLEWIDAQAIRGLLWIAGDFHLGSIGRVAASGIGATQLEVLAGPGAQTPNVLYTTLGGAQFDFATGTSNYTTFRFDPASRRVRVAFHDGDDSIITDRTDEL
jgi:alkaline phosphatase D